MGDNCREDGDVKVLSVVQEIMMMKSFTGADEVPPMDRSSPGTSPCSSTPWRRAKNQGRKEKQKTPSSVLQLCSQCSDFLTRRYNSPNPECWLICLLSIVLLLLFAGCRQVNTRLGSREAETITNGTG